MAFKRNAHLLDVVAEVVVGAGEVLKRDRKGVSTATMPTSRCSSLTAHRKDAVEVAAMAVVTGKAQQ